MGFLGWLGANAQLAASIFLTTLVGLGGVLLVGQGVHILTNFTQYDAIFECDQLSFENLGGFVLVFGLTVMMAAGMGCFGAVERINCLIITFVVLLWSFAVLEFVIAGLTLRNSATDLLVNGKHFSDVYEYIGEGLDRTFMKEFRAMELSISSGGWPTKKYPQSDVFDVMQRELDCCGSNGTDDFAAAQLAWLPNSCCPAQLRSVAGCALADAYQQGCKRTFVTWFGNTVRTLGLVASLLGVLTILKHGYLIHCSHENTINTLSSLPSLGGKPTADIFRKHPKILMTSTETMLQTIRHLQDFDISDEAVLKCPEIFTLASSSVLRRLENLGKVPEFGALIGHPRVLRLVHYQPKAENRLGTLKELQVKCASLHVLACSGTTFDKYAREGADKTKGTDIAGYLEKNLGYSDSVIRATLGRHPFWCHIPLTSVHQTLEFLAAEGFTKKQIFSSIHVLLYPKEKVEAELRGLSNQPELSVERLTPPCSGWAYPKPANHSYSALVEMPEQSSDSSSDSDDERWLTGKSGSPTRAYEGHRLDLVVYLIERAHHFTGDGVWPPSPENDTVSLPHDTKTTASIGHP